MSPCRECAPHTTETHVPCGHRMATFAAECPVCFEQRGMLAFLECEHVVCMACVGALASQCPLCRRHFAYFDRVSAVSAAILWLHSPPLAPDDPALPVDPALLVRRRAMASIHAMLGAAHVAPTLSRE